MYACMCLCVYVCVLCVCARPFQPLSHLTFFHETWFERSVTEGHCNVAFYSFIQLLITTWQTGKHVRWEWDYRYIRDLQRYRHIHKNDIAYYCVGLWPIDFRSTTWNLLDVLGYST